MQKSDLVEIMLVLTPEEQTDLRLFMEHTPNPRKECVALVNHLLDCLNQNAFEKIQKHEVYEKIFQGQEWVENKLAKLMGETLALVRKYVAGNVAQNQMSELQQLFYLQTFYQERNLEDKFWAVHRQIVDLNQKTQWQSGQDYYSRFLSENQVFLFQSARNNRKDDLNLLKAINAFDEFYLVERHWLICHLLNQNLQAPINLDYSNISFPFGLTESEFYKKILGLLFSKTIELLSNESSNNDPKELRHFIDLLRKHEHKIPAYYINLFEQSANNFAVRRVNKGYFSFLEQVFDIQKGRVESGRVYVNKGQIMATEFLSVTIHGLRLKEFDWVKNFIDTHKKKVLGVMPSQQYYEFALANFLFYCKDYQETCRILMTSDYQDIQCKISGRILEIKALAEQFFREKADYRVSEYLEDRVGAAILFFFRHKDVEATKKKMGKRFADTMKRIIQAEAKRDVERLEIILQDIQKAEYVAERQWLSKLVEELIAKHKKK